MKQGVPTKVIAASMGLSAFAVAILAGLAADNPADQILIRALACMGACCTLGWLVGIVAERAASEAIESYMKAHPIPGQTKAPGSLSSSEGAPAAAA